MFGAWRQHAAGGWTIARVGHWTLCMRNTFYPVCRVWRGGAGRGGEGRYLESVWSRASRAKCRRAALTLVKLPDMVSHDVIIISTDVTTSHHPTKPSNCLIQTCGEWETSVTILLRLAPAQHRGPLALYPRVASVPESESGTQQQVWGRGCGLATNHPHLISTNNNGLDNARLLLSASTVTPQAKTINTAHCCCKTKLAFH